MNFLSLELSSESLSVTSCQATPTVHPQGLHAHSIHQMAELKGARTPGEVDVSPVGNGRSMSSHQTGLHPDSCADEQTGRTRAHVTRAHVWSRLAVTCHPQSSLQAVRPLRADTKFFL